MCDMGLSPLATGLITGASECEDPVIETALDQMLAAASHTELQQAAVDLASLVKVLAEALAEEIDHPVDEILRLAN